MNTLKPEYRLQGKRYLKGQYSTFIKPITVLIFGGLLISLLVGSLNFDVGLSSDREQTQFQSSSSAVYSDLIRCLSGNNTNSLNKSYVRELERTVRLSQLECVNEYDVGYTVSVEQDRLSRIAPKETATQPTEVVFALDDSVSTQAYINAIKDNIERFKSDIGDSRIGIITYRDVQFSKGMIFTLPNPNTGGTYTANIRSTTGSVNLDRQLTSEADEIKNTLNTINADKGGLPQEAVYHAIQKSLDDMEWSTEANKIIILTNTDGAHDGDEVKSYEQEITESYENLGGWPDDIIDLSLPSYSRNCTDLRNVADNARDQNTTIYTLFKNHTTLAPAEVDGCSKEITRYIPDKTGGKSYDITESFNKILSEIAGNIFKDKIKYSGESTCGVPRINSYDGNAEIVVTSDISEGFGGEWQTVCQTLNRTVRKLETRGLNTRISYYAPSNPDNRDADSGLGGPAKIVNSTGGSENYSYKSSPVPSCLSYPKNNASTGSYGKGITDWNQTEIIEYNESIDSGLEAWGVSSRWILKNHDWNQSADKRALVVVGNQLPFGGNSSERSYRDGNNPDKLDGEEELVENITRLASEKNVEINAISDSFEYRGKSNYGEFDENDAAELMEYVSTETGGSYLRYNGIGEIPRKIAKQFTDISTGRINGGRCSSIGYEFGQTKGSTQESLKKSLTAKYPTTLIAKDGSIRGGTISIRLRKGALEQLAGAINQATDTGKNLGRETSLSVRLNNQKTITVRDKAVDRNKVTDYTLQQPDGNETINIRDDLVIGIDGKPVFKDFDGDESTIDFSKQENQFKSYKGASIQLIASTSSSRQKLPEIELTCANVNYCQNQTLNSQKINNTAGDYEYLRNGERGIYHTNFTEIKVGRKNTDTSELICYQNTEKCIELETEEAEDLTLRPGSNELSVTYNESYGVRFNQ